MATTPSKPRTARERFSPEAIAKLYATVEKFLDSTSGSVFIIAGDEGVDMHHRICRHCAESALKDMISDADKLGMFAEHANTA